MPFEVWFKDECLERLEKDKQYRAGLSVAIVKAFRKRMQFIRSSTDMRDFYSLRSLRFEKLKGERQHQHSIRLNDQYRHILEIEEGKNQKLLIVGIEDYH